MAQRLIVIAVVGKPKALNRLEELIDNAVIDATMAGGIDGLATETVDGAAAERARDALREAAARRPKKGNPR